MLGQLSIFDILQPEKEIPTVNGEGYIPACELDPIRWEAWHYSNSKWTMNGGQPYMIKAVLAVLPGNRLYVKEWFTYAFMHELKDENAIEKMYACIRKKIVERMEYNNDYQKTWQVNELPALRDMWRYKEGEYSEKDYAEKMLYGYRP